MPELTSHYGTDALLEDTKRREHAIVAGVGYGKTRFGPLWMEKRRRDNIRSREFLVIAPTYKLLKERAFQDYNDFLNLSGLVEGVDYKFNASYPLLDFGGQRVIGVSGDNPAAIVSYNTAGVWIDEPALCVEQVRKNVIKRNRCPKARYRQRLYTGTPEGLNWFYDVFHPDKLERKDCHSFNDSKLVLHGSSFDNPYLDEDYLTDLREEFGFDHAYFANYVLGEWVSLSKDRFYFSFSPEHNVKDCTLDLALQQFCLCWDANVGQMTWTVIQEAQALTGKEYRVVDENGSNGRNIDDACAQFVQKYPPARFKEWRISVLGDASLHARSVHSYQTGYDIIESLLRPHYPHLRVNAHRGNPFVEERSRCTNRLLSNRRLYINKACVKVIRSLKTCESDGKGGIKKPKDDTITHAMESVDMGLIVLEPNKIERRGGGANYM